MRNLKRFQQHHKVRKFSWAKGAAGVLLMALLVFAGPTPQIHAADQGTWSNDEDGGYYYTDQNGWKFSMSEKYSGACTLESVPEDMQGELNIPTKIRLDSVVRTVDLSYYFVVPKGVTKVYLPDMSQYDETDSYPYEDYLYWFSNFSEDEEGVLTVCCYEDDFYKKYLERFKFKVEYLDPATAEVIGGEAENNWSYDADKRTYCYTDENGWKYDFATKEAESYILKSIPTEAQGEITIPAEMTIEGVTRKLQSLDKESLQIPKGVTKVTFGQGIYYFSGVLFDQCSSDLVVSCYLELEKSLSEFAKGKGFKMEYQNGNVDQNNVVYYTTQQTKEDGTKGNVIAAVYTYEGSATNVAIASKVTIQGVEYNVTEIENSAFAETKVKKVTLPNTITEIDGFAFESCKSLNNVTLPKKLTRLGGGAFAGCTSLTSIEIPSGVTSLYTETFSGCTSLKKVVLSKKMQHLGDYVFYSCKKLTTITNLDQIAIIGQETFCGCSKLTSLTFGKKLSSIGSGAFYKCTSLKKVTIQSKSMEYMGSQIFYGDKKLKTVILKATNLTSKKLCSDTFKGSYKKLVVKVPAKKVNAYKKFFKNCGNKTIVVKKA